MTCDIEDVENKLLALVKSKLPAKLAQIEAQKGDGIALAVPADDQYFTGTDFDEEVLNQILFVNHGLVETGSVSISSATAKDNTYMFLIYLSELNQVRGVLRKKIFRYTRAFEEIFEENFDRLRFVSNIEIKTIVPANWEQNDASPIYKVGGVLIQTTLV